MTQAEVAQAVSKGRSTVANALRLLDLPEEAQGSRLIGIRSDSINLHLISFPYRNLINP